MVGVPGKSKGCTTCRRRKKGCDKQVPFCGQCVESGLICEGYPRHSIWINSVGDQNLSYTKFESPVHASTSGPGLEIRKGSPAGSVSSAASGSGECPIAIVQHDSLTRSAREAKYVGMYLTAYLPYGRQFSVPATKMTPGGWLRYHESLCRSEKTLRFVTLALGLSMVGTRDGDVQLKNKGLEAYRVAVQQMSLALRNKHSATSDGLLGAVRLMRFFEIFYGADPEIPCRSTANPQVEGFYAHADGEMALFTNRGWNHDWSELGRSLLADGRLVSFIVCVTRRRRCPFSQREWMTIPWRHVPKTPLEELEDIMVQLPGILEDLDSLRASKPSGDSLRSGMGLLDTCRKLQNDLESWRDYQRDTIRCYDYTIAGETIPPPLGDKAIAIIHICLLYWISCILVYANMNLLIRELHRIDPQCSIPIEPKIASPNSDGFFHERNPTLYAFRMAKSISLLSEPNAGGYGALVSTFPLGFVMKYLAVADSLASQGRGGDGCIRDERRALRELFSRPFMGSYVGRFLDNIQRVDAPTPELRSKEGEEGHEQRARTWWLGQLQNKRKDTENREQNLLGRFVTEERVEAFEQSLKTSRDLTTPLVP